MSAAAERGARGAAFSSSRQATPMATALILYHSFYGHIEAMADAAARGARSVPGTVVDVKRVPETVPAEVFRGAGG